MKICVEFLSDFYIGGFAVANCDAILARDRGIYRKYSPELQMYNPKKLQFIDHNSILKLSPMPIGRYAG